MQWIAAGDGINMNYRFSQPGRTERNRQDHLYAEGVFPFANVAHDRPDHRQDDSRYERCERTDTCPVAMEIYSANEYWVKAGVAAAHRRPTARFDLPDSPFARNYFISSHQHGGGQRDHARASASSSRIRSTRRRCSARLFVALDEWVDTGMEPPPSRVPRLADGTLVAPAAAGGGGLPAHPRRHLHRAEDDALPVELRPRLLHQGHSRRSTRRWSRRPTRTTRPTDRSIRAMCRRPTPTATTSPACACPT